VKRLLQVMLLGLVLTLVALVSALTAMRFAIHGRQVAVPNLVGMTPAEADRATSAAGLSMGIEDHFYSGDVEEGKIVSQVPAPGTMVRHGWRVRAAQSLGPQRVVVPNVVGDSQRAAEINIRRRGLEIGGIAVARLPEVAAGQVAAQSPPANANVASPKVDLLIAAPPEKPALLMPSLVGRQLSEAVKVIEAAGLHVESATSISDIVAPPNTVVRHTPAPGEKVWPGAVVSLEFAR